MTHRHDMSHSQTFSMHSKPINCFSFKGASFLLFVLVHAFSNNLHATRTPYSQYSDQRGPKASFLFSCPLTFTATLVTQGYGYSLSFDFPFSLMNLADKCDSHSFSSPWSAKEKRARFFCFLFLFFGQRPREGTKSYRMGRNSVRPSIRLPVRPPLADPQTLLAGPQTLRASLRGLKACWRGLRACWRGLRASQRGLGPARGA